MLKLAEEAETVEQPGMAAAIYRALETDPDGDIRAEARFRLAKQLLGRKRTREAATILRRLLDDKPSATIARLELAHAMQQMGDADGALRQLRAAQAAGLPPSVARLVDRYSDALRMQRRAGASFEIALAPDSNINRGTRSDTLGTIVGDFDIGDDSKARSGTGLSLQAQAFRRFPLVQSPASLLIRAGTVANLYKNKTFNDIAVDLAAGPEFRIGKGRINLEAGALWRWYGQKPFIGSRRLAVSAWHRIGHQTAVRLNASASIVDHRFNDLQDGKVLSSNVSVEHALSPTTGVAVSLGVDRQRLKDPGYSTTGWRGGLTGWRDLGQVTASIGIEVGRLGADERLLLFPEKRRDRYSKLSVGAAFRQMEWQGFAPLVRFSIERNRSTIAFYDYRRTRTEVGITRAF